MAPNRSIPSPRSATRMLVVVLVTVAVQSWSATAWAHSAVGGGDEFGRFILTLFGHVLLWPLLVIALALWTRKKPNPSRFLGGVLPVISIVVAALVWLPSAIVTLTTGVDYVTLEALHLLWAALSKEEMLGLSTAVLAFSVANLRRRKRGAERRSTGPAWLVGSSLCLAALATGPIVQAVNYELKTITAFRRFDDIEHRRGELAFSPDGDTLIALGLAPDARPNSRVRHRTRVNLWSIGSAIGWPRVKRFIGTGNDRYHVLSDVWMSADGKRVVTAETTGGLGLWSFETGEQLGLLPFADRKHGVSDKCHEVPFAVRAARKGPLQWLDLTELAAAEIAVEIPPLDEIRMVACAPAGDRIAVVFRQRVVVMTPRDAARVVELETTAANNVLGFGPDGKTLATSRYNGSTRGGTLQLWSLPEGTLRAELATEGRVRAVAFHPDGERIAVSSGDGRVSLRSLSDGKEIRPIVHLHASDPRALAFSADGKQLATGWEGMHHTILLFRL